MLKMAPPCVCESDDSMAAPTIRLDDARGGEEDDDPSPHSDSDDESVDQRDSQVSSGWLGKFYSTYGKWGKDEAAHPDVPDYVKQGDKPKILEDLRKTVVSTHGEHLLFMLLDLLPICPLQWSMVCLKQCCFFVFPNHAHTHKRGA